MKNARSRFVSLLARLFATGLAISPAFGDETFPAGTIVAQAEIDPSATYGAEAMRGVVPIDLTVFHDEREVSGFDAIDAQGFLSLKLVQGESYELVIENGLRRGRSMEPVEIAGDTLGPRGVRTGVHGTTLVIRQERVVTETGVLDWGGHADIRITLPALTSLDVSGQVYVSMDRASEFRGESLVIQARDRADIELTAVVDHLEVLCDGETDIYYKGRARELNLTASGACEFGPDKEVVLESADIHASEAAEVELAVSGRLFARARGGSIIDYDGDPAVVDIEADAGAEID